jgi:hypothetical protein
MNTKGSVGKKLADNWRLGQMHHPVRRNLKFKTGKKKLRDSEAVKFLQNCIVTDVSSEVTVPSSLVHVKWLNQTFGQHYPLKFRVKGFLFLF